MTSVRQTGVKLINGCEYDAFSRFRHVVHSFRKAGKVKAIKQAYNRRVRRTVSLARWVDMHAGS